VGGGVADCDAPSLAAGQPSIPARFRFLAAAALQGQSALDIVHQGARIFRGALLRAPTVPVMVLVDLGPAAPAKVGAAVV